jgi:predicted CXXCH cytochrome family protein
MIFRLSLMLLAVCAAPVFAQSIVFTRHNLSVSGPGEVKAATETQICIFCHTPHAARREIPFLWNRADETVSYIPYQSSTLFASVGQPTGASKLCLSCHDGTIALGAVISRQAEIPFLGGIRFMPAARPAYLGTDLSDDHPVSFVYDSTLARQSFELVDPAMLPPQIKLDARGELQCTACHNPHDDTFGKFLVMTNQFSVLCTSCHQKQGWPASSHALSGARWNGQGTDPWPRTDFQTVAENGCENCHMPHSAPSHQWLLKHVFEEDTCLACHNGNVAAANIERELTQPFRHPVQSFTGIHDPNEDFTAGNVPVHVECVDCHEPHRASGIPSPGAPIASGATSGVTGVDLTGLQIPEAQNQYEICFKCHADNNVLQRLPITRQIDQLNTRLEFDPANPSFHPVSAPGINPDVPSLLPPLRTNSIIFCTDCHNSDNPAGPKGPHGSSFEFLLERNYTTLDRTSESSFNYAMCYKCHNRNSILRDESFSEHRLHIVEENAPCSACHDPHGVSILQGNPANNSHLINFDLTIVQPNREGNLFFEDLGRFRGQCFLTCHGERHEPKSYP